MSNQYHDAMGKFTSKNGMNKAITQAINNGDMATALRLQEDFNVASKTHRNKQQDFFGNTASNGIPMVLPAPPRTKATFTDPNTGKELSAPLRSHPAEDIDDECHIVRTRSRKGEDNKLITGMPPYNSSAPSRPIPPMPAQGKGRGQSLSAPPRFLSTPPVPPRPTQIHSSPQTPVPPRPAKRQNPWKKN